MTARVEPESTPARARLAFLITSHTDIVQLTRLVNRLLAADPSALVYISHDRAGEPGAEALASSRCRIVTEEGGRGDFTQIQRILSLMSMLEEDGGADFATVLSGADYPSRPIEEFFEALKASGDGFLHHFTPLIRGSSDWSMHEGRQRYLFRWRMLRPLREDQRRRWHFLHGVNYIQPLFRVNVSYGGLRVGTRRRGLPAGLDCWGGSAWFSVSRRALQHLLHVARTRPDVMDWARTSLAPDEVFAQSILLSTNIFHFVNDNRRYIDFDGDGFGHPRVLDLGDLDKIVDSGSYFVRKVESRRSAELLDALDELSKPSAGHLPRSSSS